MGGALDGSFAQLATVIPFDAVQLLRFHDRRPPEELYRRGYSATTAWALAHLFPEELSSEFSDRDTLPPTLSTSKFAGEFTRSTLYRDYLAAEGYADMMTLGLHHGTAPVGLAHFASRRKGAFKGESRRFGRAVSGLFGQLTSMAPPAAHWWADMEVPNQCLREQLIADPWFAEYLHSSHDSYRTHLEHLWWVGRTAVRVSVRQAGDFSARLATPEETHQLTRQELQVLSVLCCGSSDADIAERLVISPRTVQSHINKIRQKLDAVNRLEAAVIAIGQGIYIPDPRWAPLSQIVRVRPRQPPLPAHR